MFSIGISPFFPDQKKKQQQKTKKQKKKKRKEKKKLVSKLAGTVIICIFYKQAERIELVRHMLFSFYNHELP